jgi:geranylgeranyl reductase family protein
MLNRQNFDLLIVGAGPAGSSAAEGLARAGLKVALFDGRPSNEPKACGGGVTSKALKLWPHLHNANGRIIDEVQMCSPSGRVVQLKLKQPFVIYSRRALDSYLRERAAKAGAEIIKEKVSLLPDNSSSSEKGWSVRSKDGTEWSGRMLIAADGANSSIGRHLAGTLPTSEMEVAFGYRTPLPKVNNAPTVVAFLPGWAGYAWAFPRLDHISFGIATTQDSFDHKALDDLLWRFMVGYYQKQDDSNLWMWSRPERGVDHAANIEESLRSIAERYAARIPGLSAETWNKRKVSGDGWTLLGDAAGFADPVTGEGIYYALRSAELFVESYLSGNPSRYEELWRKDFGLELCRAAQMRDRFYGNFLGGAFTDRMIEFASMHKGINRTLCELIAGDQVYVDLKRRLLKRAIWPFK